MTKHALILAALYSTLSYAAERDLRSFDCEAQFKDAHEGSGSFSVVLNDLATPDLENPGIELYWSHLEFAAPFISIKAVMNTERDTEDAEVERDDNPQGRNGWGGTAFYGMILKGTDENPLETLMVVTKADREQQGKTERSYRFAAIKMTADDVDAHSSRSQEKLAEGTFSCTQRTP
ncbi:MAG: hypothetical protein ABIR96_05115 [Bdellovibrionota bacterium]